MWSKNQLEGQLMGLAYTQNDISALMLNTLMKTFALINSLRIILHCSKMPDRMRQMLRHFRKAQGIRRSDRGHLLSNLFQRCSTFRNKYHSWPGTKEGMTAINGACLQTKQWMKETMQTERGQKALRGVTSNEGFVNKE